MFIQVNASGEAAIREAEKLNELSLRAPRLGNSSLSDVLTSAGLGYLSDGFAWLNLLELREQAGVRSREWTKAFHEMIEFARHHGWISKDGQSVRAHIEFEESS